MISLTPIAKNIQQRLLEKMKILGRENTAIPGTSKNGGLTHDKLAIRSTFLRMISNQPYAVTLMGGKLKDDDTIAGGYDDIYGPRTYKKRGKVEEGSVEAFNQGGMGHTATQRIYIDEKTGEPRRNIDKTTVNKGLKRPLPGVTSADIVFRGSMGLRSLREATISWTCWGWGELDELMPHFLAHGQRVLLQWGWVYDKKTLLEIPTFLEPNPYDSSQTYINASAYKNYQKKVNERNGDFDQMIGIIKNFEYTAREDGGFDCQTIITSVGQSILQNPEPNASIVNPSIIYNLSLQEDERIVADRLKDATGEEGTRKTTQTEKDKLIKINSSVTLKAFIANIDDYLHEDMDKALKKSAGMSATLTGDVTFGEYHFRANKLYNY